ncbi:hypothetical protein A9F06_14425 [Klebsiella pneumoniae]|nr:hypothetical protein A9F06_14425 [Klebsiella pneumoniae]
MWLSKEVLHTSLLYTSPRRDAVIVTLFAAVSFILPAVFLNSPAVAAMRRKSWKALRKAKKASVAARGIL